MAWRSSGGGEARGSQLREKKRTRTTRGRDGGSDTNGVNSLVC